MKTPANKTAIFKFLPTELISFPLKKTLVGRKSCPRALINTGFVNFLPTIPTIFSNPVKNTEKAWLWLLVLPDRVEPLGVNPPCDRAHIDNFAKMHNLTLLDAIPIYSEALAQNWRH